MQIEFVARIQRLDDSGKLNDVFILMIHGNRERGLMPLNRFLGADRDAASESSS